MEEKKRKVKEKKRKEKREGKENSSMIIPLLNGWMNEPLNEPNLD